MLIDDIMAFIKKKHKPVRFQFDHITASSFTGYAHAKSESLSQALSKFTNAEIETKGIHLQFKIMYVFEVGNRQQQMFLCQHMKDLQSQNPLDCPIYHAMKEKYRFKQTGLQHLEEQDHFVHDTQKPDCRHKDDCYAYNRLKNGGNRLDDRCHVVIYKHTPKQQTVHLEADEKPFVVSRSAAQNHPVYQPTEKDKKKYAYNDKDGFLKAMIEEVILNGFKSDLCLQCRTEDECKHNDHSILEIVEQKMKRIRHKQMGCPLRRDHMLALVMYTSEDCNYDLCSSQRNGDYQKWKWFDLLLFEAIKRLSERESHRLYLFGALAGVKQVDKFIEEGWFVSFVSTSWLQDIALTFMGDNGMFIQCDPDFVQKSVCCDVSWISKFPDECEILFSRSVNKTYARFEAEITDASADRQVVVLREPIKQKRKQMMQTFRDLNNTANERNEFKDDNDDDLKQSYQNLYLQRNIQASKMIIVKCHVFCKTDMDRNYGGVFSISVPYTHKYSIAHLIGQILRDLEAKHAPTSFAFSYIDDDSFTKKTLTESDNLYEPITNYSKDIILQTGIFIHVFVPIFKHFALTKIDCPEMLAARTTDKYACSFYVRKKKNKETGADIRQHFLTYSHRNRVEKIDCPEMKGNDDEPLQCKYWKSMSQHQVYSHDNLKHMNNYTHFKNELESKPRCREGDRCKLFVNVVNGSHNVRDLCHMMVYLHPPRRRNIFIDESSGFGEFQINSAVQQNIGVYEPSQFDKLKYKYTDSDGFVYALVEEVITNGFKYDLCLRCSNDDKKCDHDADEIKTDTEWNILKTVADKLGCKRHRQMGSPLNSGEMLSLILYTGCECNYDLCKKQREGDYTTWKWFDYCLYSAITKLGLREWGSYTLWSGVSGIKLTKSFIANAYFKTYTSSSWRRKVADSFMKGKEEKAKGLMMKIDESFREGFGSVCCDVSWISKFRHENEVLIARGTNKDEGFQVQVIDHEKGDDMDVQIVLISKAKKQSV